MRKNKALLPLFLLATSLLVGCSSSTIVSRPDWKDKTIIDVDNLKDNKLKAVYDAIKGLSDTNSSLLNRVLYDIAKKYIGDYYEIFNLLKEDASKENIDKFINEHLMYKNDGFTVVKGEKKQLNDDERRKLSLETMALEVYKIEDRVFEKLFNEIKDASYSTDSLFFEARYLLNLRKNLYDVDTIDNIKTKVGEHFSQGAIFVPKKSYEGWVDYVNATSGDEKGFLHVYKNLETREYYDKMYKDYIDRKILPDVYRESLVEKYVHDQRYSNLGRSYARKVKMITIANGGTDYKAQFYRLFSNFTKDYVKGDKKGLYDLHLLEKAAIGLADTDTNSLLVAAGFNAVQTNTGTIAPMKWPLVPTQGYAPYSLNVYKGTKLGDLVEKYLKVYDVEHTSDGNFKYTIKETLNEEAKTAYNDLTNSGAYPIEHGLELKFIEILTTSLVKSGWYLKDGGLSDLNGDIRERLFNISVSNIVDSSEKKSGGWKTSDYARYFNDVADEDRAFLTGKNLQQKAQEDYETIVLDDNSNYHIIEIEEAISTSKLSNSLDNPNSYRYLKSNDKYEGIDYISDFAFNNIVADVVRMNAQKDTYKTNANQYYLMISNVLVSDQSVYDYLKSQYPDLFK